MTSPLLADGDHVLFAGAAGDPPAATVHRYTPAEDTLIALAEFVPAGPLSAIARSGDDIVIAHGQQLTFVAPDGGQATVRLPGRGRALVEPADGDPPQDLPQDIRDLAVIGTTVYATRFDVPGVEVVGRGAGTEPALLPLPGGMAPPVGIDALASGMLLVSSPFNFYDLPGGAVLLDPRTGETQRLDARPVATAPVDGRLLATQASTPGLFRLEADGSWAAVELDVPSTGREDLLAAHDGLLVTAPEGIGALFVYREGIAGADRLDLPVFEGEPSRPYSPDTGTSRPEPVRSPARVSSIAITDDGHTVSIATAGAGLAMGVFVP